MADSLYYTTKFAIGTYDQIDPAIKDGTLTYPAYVYISDEKQLAFINKDLSVDVIRGDAQVLLVDELPPIEDADRNVLYIYNNNVYVFTGEAYRPLYSDVSDQVMTEVIELGEKVDAFGEEVKSLAQVVENMSSGSSGLIFDEYENFPTVGVSNQLYIDITENVIYRYDDTAAAYTPLPDLDGLESSDELPITVLIGMADEVINVDELEPGTYFVTGYYKIHDEDEVITTSEYIPFLVSSNEEGIFVTEFNGGEITRYGTTDTGDVEDHFATKDYVSDSIDEATANYVTQEYVENYVQDYVDEAILGAMKERY